VYSKGRKEGGKRKRRGRKGKGDRKGEGGGKKRREDTCTSCHHFYITIHILFWKLTCKVL
jgi:hypothetical protein